MHYCFLTFGAFQGNTRLLRFRELGRELLRRGLRVTYLVDDFACNTPQVLGLDPAAQVLRMPIAGALGNLRSRRRTLGAIRPDALHVLNASIKSMLTLIGLRHQHIVGDWEDWNARLPGMSPLRRFGERVSDAWHRRRCDLVVVTSRYLQEEFRALGLDPLYLPYAAYLPPQADDGATPFDAPAAVYMGMLFPQYDHDLLFEAARLLGERGRHPRIEVVGGGAELEKYREFCAGRGLDNVRFAGFKSGVDLWRYLRHAQVLLFPIRTNRVNLSRCPSKTYAYAQARRPIITSRVGEVAAVLAEQAIYVDETAAAYADALQGMMASARPADVEYDLSRMTWAARADTLIDALKSRGLWRD